MAYVEKKSPEHDTSTVIDEKGDLNILFILKRKEKYQFNMMVIVKKKNKIELNLMITVR